MMCGRLPGAGDLRSWRIDPGRAVAVKVADKVVDTWGNNSFLNGRESGLEIMF